MEWLTDFYKIAVKWSKHNFKDPQQREDFVQYVMMKCLEKPNRKHKPLYYFKVDWLRDEFGRTYKGNGKRKRRIRLGDVVNIGDDGDNAAESIIDKISLGMSDALEIQREQDENIDHKKLTQNMMKYLTVRERIVIKMKFYDEMNLKEIAKKLMVSDSLICQILKHAIRKLRRSYDDDYTI